MKLVTFRLPGAEPAPERERIGLVLADGRILELGAADPRLAVDMLTLIREQDALLPRVRALAAAPPPAALRAPGALTLLAPVPRPVALRDGYAFREHVAAARRNRGLDMLPEFDRFPVTYFGNHQTVLGPGPVEVLEHHLPGLDYELEVAVVIGRPLHNCTLEAADAAIFGFLIMNDWSARGLQMEEMRLSLGPCKGKDFATGLGPWLVTPDELPLRATPRGRVLRARMSCAVNGRILSAGNADTMAWTFAQILQRGRLRRAGEPRRGAGQRHRGHRLPAGTERGRDGRTQVARPRRPGGDDGGGPGPAGEHAGAGDRHPVAGHPGGPGAAAARCGGRRLKPRSAGRKGG